MHLSGAATLEAGEKTYVAFVQEDRGGHTQGEEHEPLNELVLIPRCVAAISGEEMHQT